LTSNAQIASAISSCVLGLLHRPEVLKRAQKEIDDVVGTNRLPSFGDQDSLPYVTAIMKEAMRWRDVSPLGMLKIFLKKFSGWILGD
jgi:cytochrome P450